MILCHELGHTLGGAPYVGVRSVEGQADYYATSKCLPRLWKSEDNAAVINNLHIPQTIAERCKTTFTGESIALCVRSNLTSLKLSSFLLRGAEVQPPQIHTPDLSVKNTSSYYIDYPSLQCRLDTLLAGAYCKIDPYSPVDKIRDTNTGCASGIAARPLCWFQPALSR